MAFYIYGVGAHWMDDLGYQNHYRDGSINRYDDLTSRLAV